MTSVADPTVSQDALYRACVVHRVTDRRRGVLLGDRAAETLNGLITNNVASLGIGEGCYAVALTPRGRIIADLRVFRRADHILLDAVEPAWDGLQGMLRKYVNPRLSRSEDRSRDLSELQVAGPGSEAALKHVVGLTAPQAPWATIEASCEGAAVLVACTPGLEVPAYSVFAPPDVIGTVSDRLLEAGASPADPAALDAARIAAGYPRWGVDMDDTTLAQEANMDALGAISYTKGCYTGQETVARVHFRGHVNRLLRGLRFETGDLSARTGATVEFDGNPAGDVRSVARTSRFGAIALAMLRREVEPGTTVTVPGAGHRDSAIVVELPFDR